MKLYLISILIFLSSFITAQDIPDALKKNILINLRSSNKFDQEYAIVNAGYYNVPESLPILEDIIWQQDQNTIFMILDAIYKYNTADFLNLAHQALDRIDTMNAGLNKNDFLTQKAYIGLNMMRNGDTSAIHFVIDLIESMKPGFYSGGASLLRQIYDKAPEYHDYIKSEMKRILSFPDAGKDAYTAIIFLNETFPDESSPLLLNVLDNKNIDARSYSLQALVHKDYPGILNILMDKFVTDSALSHEIEDYLLTFYFTPSVYKFLQENIPLMKDTSHREILLELFTNVSPPMLDSTMTISLMMNTLNDFTDSCYTYHWIGPDSLYATLKTLISQSKQSLVNKDSVTACRRIQDYKHILEYVFTDSLRYRPAFVKPGAWSFLYYYSGYILDSLPACSETKIIPPTIAAGSHNVVLLVYSSGLNPNNDVMFNNVGCKTTRLNDSLLKAEVDDSLVANPGSYRLQIVRNKPYYQLSDYYLYRVTRGIPVLSLSPSIAVTGSGGFPLHVTGKGFTTGSKVLWNNSPRSTTYRGDTLLSASITAADISIAGKYAVTVTSGDSLNIISDSLVFLVTDQLPKPIRLLEEKMTDNHDGTFTVCFGYDNANDGAVYISGSSNAFTPGNSDRGQPVLFLPGRHKYAFCANFKSGEEAT